MASLRSRILDGRLICSVHRDATESEKARRFDEDGEVFSIVRGQLRRQDTILVNAQPVLDDIRLAIRTDSAISGPLSRGEFWAIPIPCPKPPYRYMWLEGLVDGERNGIMMARREIDDVEALIKEFQTATMETLQGTEPGNLARGRQVWQLLRENPPATLMQALCWVEMDGAACFEGTFIYWLDADGNFLSSFRTPNPLTLRGEEFDNAVVRLRCLEFWALQTFGRLNCHNVTLKAQPPDRPGRKRAKSPMPPSSVWHEIVVRSVADLRSQKPVAELLPDGEKREIRFHRVRGHYADYTRGKGLFGRWKVRIWVEEHTVGDPERGTVVSSYTVQ